jgi:hypothetical protein
MSTEFGIAHIYVNIYFSIPVFYDHTQDLGYYLFITRLGDENTKYCNNIWNISVIHCYMFHFLNINYRFIPGNINDITCK